MAEGAVTGVFLAGNRIEGLTPPAGGAVFTADRPTFTCGYESLVPEHSRHLP